MQMQIRIRMRMETEKEKETETETGMETVRKMRTVPGPGQNSKNRASSQWSADSPSPLEDTFPSFGGEPAQFLPQNASAFPIRAVKRTLFSVWRDGIPW